MNFLTQTEIADLKTAKKAALVSAAFSLVVSNLEFISTEIRFLGISFRFNVADLVTFSRVAAFFFALVFLAHAINMIYAEILNFAVSRNKKLENQDRSEMKRLEAEYLGADLNFEQDIDPWVEHFQKKQVKRYRLEVWLKRSQLAWNIFTNILANYVVVVLFSFFAVYDPVMFLHLLREVQSWLGSSRGQEP